MDNLGEYIRRQREAKQLTIQELSEKTKISVAILRDIEAGKFDRYKGDEAYVKMYLKKISNVLNMDTEGVTQQYIDLTREIKQEELREKEEHIEEKPNAKGKKFSFEAPQLTRKPSVYENNSHVTIIRTAIILILVCLLIAVVWYGIYATRSSSDNPNFVPSDKSTIEGDVNTPNEDSKDDGNATTDDEPTDAGITFTRNDKLDFNFKLPAGVEEVTLKIEFMQKSWAKLWVNGKVYNDFESKIYHNNDTEEPETIELTFKVSELSNIKLQNGYSMGHRYYINGQQIPLIDEDYSEGVTYLKLNLVKE